MKENTPKDRAALVRRVAAQVAPVFDQEAAPAKRTAAAIKGVSPCLERVLTSARRSSSAVTIALFPYTAAHMRAELPCASLVLTAALRDRSARKVPRLPRSAASIRAVSPPRYREHREIPAASCPLLGSGDCIVAVQTSALIGQKPASLL